MNLKSIFILICLLSCLSIASDPTVVSVYTDTWKPYINEEYENDGVISEIVELSVLEMDKKVEWEYLHYYFGYRNVKKSNLGISFPYFKTSERLEEVYFSVPLYLVPNSLFYVKGDNLNRNYTDTDIKIGAVLGFSYGADIDKRISQNRIDFSSELKALHALAAGEVDYLAIASHVGTKLIYDYYPHRVHEFKVVSELTSTAPVHLIASKTEEGLLFVEEFNRAFLKLKGLGLFDDFPIEFESSSDRGLVKLVPAEGFPLISAYFLNSSGERNFYVIPQGSKAKVLEWDSLMLQAQSEQDVFSAMMNYTKLEIKSGPHKGKVLFVRNVHIEVQ